MMRLLLDTGGRQMSEVAGLAVADVDFDADVRHVLGKGRRPRALPFGQQCGPGPANHMPTRPSCGWRRKTAGRCPPAGSGRCLAGGATRSGS